MKTLLSTMPSGTEPDQKPEQIDHLRSIVLSITLNNDGSINVQGPIHDRIVCYGLLEMAKDAIRDRHSQPQNVKDKNLLNAIKGRMKW